MHRHHVLRTGEHAVSDNDRRTDPDPDPVANPDPNCDRDTGPDADSHGRPHSNAERGVVVAGVAEHAFRPQDERCG